jgi:hypothetical protein
MTVEIPFPISAALVACALVGCAPSKAPISADQRSPVERSCPDGHVLVDGVCSSTQLQEQASVEPPDESSYGEDRLRPNDYRVLDDRRAAAPHPRSTILHQIQVLDRLLKTTPRKDAGRPDLLLRLGYLYSEMAAGAEAPAPLARRKEKQIEKAARKRAVAAFAAVVKNHPQHCHGTGSAKRCNDAILHYLAFEQLGLGNDGEAGDAWRRLIRSWPQSTFVGPALVGLAVIAERAEEHELAARLFEKATATGERRLHGFASYHRGLACEELGDSACAEEAFGETLAFVAAHPDAAAAEELASDAREALPHGALQAQPGG